MRRLSAVKMFGAGHGYVCQPPFFFQSAAAAFVQRPLVRKQAFFPAGQEYGVKFQPLGRVQGDQHYLVGINVVVVVHYQTDMFHKVA